jgi:hypothetical protein
MKKPIKNYQTPACNQMQLESSGVLASSFIFGNHALGIDEANTTEYNPEWF